MENFPQQFMTTRHDNVVSSFQFSVLPFQSQHTMIIVMSEGATMSRVHVEKLIRHKIQVNNSKQSA